MADFDPAQIIQATTGDQEDVPHDVASIVKNTYAPPEAPSPEERRIQQARDYYGSQADQNFGPMSLEYKTERIPFVGVADKLAGYYNLHAAKEAKDNGTATPRQLDLIGEHLARQDYQASRTNGQGVLDFATKVPTMAAEFAASGGLGTAVGEAAGAGAARLGLGAAGQGAARYGAGLVAQTAATPTLYLDKGVSNNEEAGRLPLDPRGFGKAGGLALAQMAVLGQVGKLTGKAFTGNGLAQATGRVLTQGATGPFAQAAQDVTGYALGLDTHYGTIEDIVDGKYGEALKHAAIDSMQYATFALAHEVVNGGKGHPKEAGDQVKQVLDEQGKKGATPDQAAQAIREKLKEKIPEVQQPAQPEVPKAYSQVNDQDLITTAKGLGMSAEDKAKRGDFTRADAERYLQSKGVREEMLSESSAAPQVIQPAAPKTVTMYHGGEPGEGSPMWVTPDLEYARGYARKSGSPVYSLEVPENHPLLRKAFDDSGTNMKAPYTAFEAPPELAKNRKLHEPPEVGAPQATVIPAETSPVGKAFTEAFPGAEKHPERNEWKADFGGRTIYALHDPETNNVRIDFGWKGKAPEGTATTGPRANVAKNLQPESREMIRKLGGFIDSLREAGTGVEYTAQDGRADVYRRMMERAGFEQASGPEKHTEGTATYSWKPFVEPPEVTQPANDIHAVFDQAGLTDREKHVLIGKTMGRTFEEIGKDDDVFGQRLTRARIQQIEKKARAKIKEATGQDFDSIYKAVNEPDRASARQDLQNKVNKDAKDVIDYSDALGQGAPDPEGDYQEKWLKYLEKNHEAIEALNPTDHATHDASVADAVAKDQDPPESGLAGLPERKPVEQASVRPEGAGSVQPRPAHGPEAEAAQGQGSEELGRPANAGERQATGYQLTSLEKAQLANPNTHPFLKENLQRRAAGQRTLYDEIRQKGIDPSADELQGAGKEDWYGKKGKLPKSLFKKGGADLGELAERYGTTPEGFLEMLHQHHLVDAGVAYDRELERQHAEYVANQEAIHEQITKDNATVRTQAEAQRLIPEIVQSGEEAGARESRDQRSADVIEDFRTEAGQGEPAGPSGSSKSGPTGGGFIPFNDQFRRERGTNEPITGPSEFGRPISESERRGTGIGGGQEEAPGAEQRTRPQEITALANEITERERAKDKLPPLTPSERLENSEVWQGALRTIERDPQASQKLVDELSKKMRPVTVEENALLLYHKIALRNELERAFLNMSRELTGKRVQDVDAITWDRLDGAVRNAEQELQKVQQLIHDAGTPLGRALQFRRQLAAEDYSLGGMLTDAAAAKGRRLTPEEMAKVKEMSDKITDLQKQLDEALKAREGTKIGSKEDRAWTEAKVKFKRATGEWQDSLQKDRDSNKPFTQQMTDWLIKLRRAFVISSPTTFAKIAAASAERLGIAPMEEAVGGVLGQLPGISKIAEVAPREGKFSTNAEKKAAASAWGQGMIDAWQTAKTGKSELDVLYGKPQGPRSWLDFAGEMHAAAKAPAVRAEFTRSFLKRADAMIAQGKDPSTPAAMIQIGVEAYKDSQRAKFQQDNRVVDAYNRAVATLTAKDASIGAKAIGTGLKLALPVVRIPTNLVAETIQYATGAVTGTARLALAMRNGVENLKPAEADVIMRSLKKGSLGVAALALGYANPQMFGGYYSGKRDESDVGAGGIRTPAGEIPSWALHNPLLEVLQLGATIRRAADKYTKTGRQGESEGVVAGMAGLMGEVPFMREAKDLGSMISTSPKERGYAFGEFAKSLAVPQLVQWLAGQTDRNAAGKPIKRKPETTFEHIKTGIPGLRETVPAR